MALRRLTESKAFNAVVLTAILAASVVVGLETYPGVEARLGPLLRVLDTAIVGVFVVEILIRLGAEGRRPWRYLADPWNAFDFAIVVVTVLPIGGTSAAVLRLVRLLRVLRLFRALPRLRMILSATLKTFSSMGYVGLLLFVHLYIFSVIGLSLFGRNDPVHFGSLERAFLTLFQVLTLEGWIDVMKIQMLGADRYGYEGQEHLIVEAAAFPVVGPLYFVVFIMAGTMIILNLLIGVITSGMAEAQHEAAAEEQARGIDRPQPPPPDGLADRLAQAEAERDALRVELARVRQDGRSG